MPTEKLTFTGHDGSELAARIDRPEGRSRAVALFAHCFTCGKDIAAARRIAARLSALGIAVLRFDFTGLGHSEGEFANTGFSANVADIVAAAAHLAARGEAPQLLVGHSLGGAAVLAAAGRIESARAVAVIGAPADPAHVLGHLGASVETIRDEGTAEVSLAGRPFRISRQFVEDIESATLHDCIATMKRALLILHAPRDETVGIDNASAIFTAAKHPKSFVSLDGADHLLTRAEDAEYAAETIAAWAPRYLAMAEPEAPAADLPEGVTRVSEAGRGEFLQDVVFGGGRPLMQADEPPAVGGEGRGPSPYELVAAGLGACTSMTIRMYARRKGWPLDHVSVDVTHGKSHLTDCEGCTEKPRRIDVFRRVISLEGALDDDQRDRLLAIADRCPVHRTLEAEARIETELD
jgi:putative redox protein